MSAVVAAKEQWGPLVFIQNLTLLDVPVWTAPVGGHEYQRPNGWATLTSDGNAARVSTYQRGHAFAANMGGQVAVVDVDTKNGADIDKTRAALEGVGVRIYADVATPSGGRHFYVAGHPDLPTVHASTGRDGLTGHPGVEIMSYGTNVFLPGTTRAKYDGAGYVVLEDNLEALADGGDDDSADALAGWVAERRASVQVCTPKPAPPWDGAPPDHRQVAYLDAAVTRQVEQVAAMRADSGRNVATYTAALKLGSYVAGAGLDQQRVIDGLLSACARNGLVTEDGEAAVMASIRSGLRNGRNTPRAVPPAHDTIEHVDGATVDTATGEVLNVPPSVEPVTLAEAHGTFSRWLGADYDTGALDAVLAVAAVERMTGDPLWLLLVSGSGNAKTETVQALSGAGAMPVSTIASEGALLSATSKREVGKGATGGLLREIGDRGVLVVKDVTSILSMNRDQRAAVLGALREVYDGNWTRSVGTDGGRRLEWSGRVGLVGAVTTAWDTAHAVIAACGDRFVLVRMDSSTGRVAAGRQAIGNTGHEVQMRAELAAAVGGVIAGATLTPDPVTEAESDRLLAAADLVTLARTAVEFDYRGDVIDAHAPEMPTRFAKQLAQILLGAVAIGVERDDALSLAIRCARDSMPPMRLAIVDDLAANPDSTTAEVRKRIGKPRTTVDRQLQALHMLGVAECEEEEREYAGQPSIRWRYSLADGIDPGALQKPSRNVTTHLDLREETTKTEGPSRIGTDISGHFDSPSETKPRCATCGEPMRVYEPGQTRHPGCQTATAATR